jgi:hypothetical protein
MKNLLTLIICLTGAISWASNEVESLQRYVKMSKQQRQLLNNVFNAKTRALLNAYSSGDIVGNGGGIIEQNFHFAFNSVLPAIDHCVIKLNCDLSNEEKIVLLDIKSTYFSKLDEDFHFVFLREEDAKGLFNETLDPAERIAKTGFSSDFPIFINLDSVEKSEGLAQNLGALIAIVIHELGHQAGYASHSVLDEIAGKLRLAFSYQMDNTSLDIEGDKLLVNIYNNSESLRTQVSYYFNNQLRHLSYPIEDKLVCENNRRVIGYALSNQHWDRLKKSLVDYKAKLSMWIDIFCEDETGTIYTDEKDIEIDFLISKQTKKIKSHQIKIK